MFGKWVEKFNASGGSEKAHMSELIELADVRIGYRFATVKMAKSVSSIDCTRESAIMIVWARDLEICSMGSSLS